MLIPYLLTLTKLFRFFLSATFDTLLNELGAEICALKWEAVTPATG